MTDPIFLENTNPETERGSEVGWAGNSSWGDKVLGADSVTGYTSICASTRRADMWVRVQQSHATEFCAKTCASVLNSVCMKGKVSKAIIKYIALMETHLYPRPDLQPDGVPALTPELQCCRLCWGAPCPQKHTLLMKSGWSVTMYTWLVFNLVLIFCSASEVLGLQVYVTSYSFCCFSSSLSNPYWPRTHSPVYVPKCWDYRCGAICMVKTVGNHILALPLSYIPWLPVECFNVSFSMVTYTHKKQILI